MKCINFYLNPFNLTKLIFLVNIQWSLMWSSDLQVQKLENNSRIYMIKIAMRDFPNLLSQFWHVILYLMISFTSWSQIGWEAWIWTKKKIGGVCGTRAKKRVEGHFTELPNHELLTMTRLPHPSNSWLQHCWVYFVRSVLLWAKCVLTGKIASFKELGQMPLMG